MNDTNTIQYKKKKKDGEANKKKKKILKEQIEIKFEHELTSSH
jgi:hypothetical protein